MGGILLVKRYGGAERCATTARDAGALGQAAAGLAHRTQELRFGRLLGAERNHRVHHRGPPRR